MHTAKGSPWQNPIVERLVGSIRRECLDHIIVLGGRHLQKVLNNYRAYYNKSRCHLGLGKETSEPREVETPEMGAEIIAIPHNLPPKPTSISHLSFCPLHFNLCTYAWTPPRKKQPQLSLYSISQKSEVFHFPPLRERGRGEGSNPPFTTHHSSLLYATSAKPI